ncbi:MAG: hypothetical protein MJ172_09180 [Clostridia bacterium]|nr:hypothetical protein [Clostridia bacterium]
MKLLKKNLKATKALATITGILWLMCFSFYIITTKEYDSFWKIIYPIGLVWCGSIGQIAYNAKEERTVVIVVWIQIVCYFLNSLFYGIGSEHAFEDAYHITSLLFMFENFVFLEIYSNSKKNKGESESDDV